MYGKLKRAVELKQNDIFATIGNDVSYFEAKVTSAKIKDEYEVEIEYEFEVFGKVYKRRDILPKNNYVLIIE